jgi:hypothetical protein
MSQGRPNAPLPKALGTTVYRGVYDRTKAPAD